MEHDAFFAAEALATEVAALPLPASASALIDGPAWAALVAGGTLLSITNADDRPLALRGWAAYAGETDAALLAGGWRTLLHPDDAAAAEQTWRAGVAMNRAFTREARLRRADGTYRWFTLATAPVATPASSAALWLTTATDSTASKEALAEAALREREAHVTFAHAQVGITHMSVTGHFLRVNPRFSQMVGYRAEELIGQHSSAITHPDDHTPDRGLIDAYAEGTLHGHVSEKRYLHRDGSTVWVRLSVGAVRDEMGRMLHTVSVIEDITEAKRLAAERERLQSEVAAKAEQFEALFAAMTDGVFVFDAQGNVLYANEAVRRILALDADPDYMTRPASERLRVYQARYVDGTPMPREEMAIYRLLRGETLNDANAQDMLARALDGRDVLVSVTGAPTRDSAGNVTGAILTLREVTARQRAEQDRAEMMNYVAHELKHPLTTMSTALQLIRRRVQAGEPVPPERFALAERGLVRMERMIHDLSEAARLDHGQTVLHLAPTDLITLAREMAHEQEEASGRAIQLKLPKAPLMAEIDEGRIQQVLANLLGNAIKYTPPESHVTLTLRRKHGCARFEISDNGPGISPDAQARLFERFYRVPGAVAQQRSGLGLGLGLYVAHQIVLAHGGTMGVQSAPGAGSTFWFTLPLTALPHAE